MIGVQSLWTGTGMFALRRGSALIHTLAACMARNVFKVTELVTDTQGLEIADRLGWQYTNYVNSLDRIATSGTRHIWALGKLQAVASQDEPFCHLDNDVLLHKPFPAYILNARIFAQSKDLPNYYRSDETLKAIEVASLPKTAVAYNTGIIGGMDVTSLRTYAIRALDLAWRFNGSTLNGTTTSMVIEQHFLGAFAHRNRIKVEELIPMNPVPSDLDEAGYTHLIGRSKLEPRWIEKCEERLKRDFPDDYYAFLKGWKIIGGNS